MEGNNVDNQPTSIVKLSQDREYAHLLSNFSNGESFGVLVLNIMSMQTFMDKLIKISFSNILIRQ